MVGAGIGAWYVETMGTDCGAHAGSPQAGVAGAGTAGAHAMAPHVDVPSAPEVIRLSSRLSLRFSGESIRSSTLCTEKEPLTSLLPLLADLRSTRRNLRFNALCSCLAFRFRLRILRIIARLVEATAATAFDAPFDTPLSFT